MESDGGRGGRESEAPTHVDRARESGTPTHVEGARQNSALTHDSQAPRDEPSASRPEEDKALGKYRFIAALGRGGMADVYLAVVMGPAGFSKLQVLKRLRPSLADEPELRTMFLDEARLAARLNHRNVVQTNEVGLIDDQYFIAMEYLDGQPYHRIISASLQKGRPLPLGVSLRILCDVLSGLHYAHELVDYDGTPLGVVHRDVSPQNVFVTYDGQIKIVDFGIAKAARRAIETQAGVIKGKVAYMAPEQAFSPSSEVDRRADLFAVGVMLWEAIAGRRLWQGMSDPQIIVRVRDSIPRLLDVKPDTPPDLARICDQVLSPAPGDRPATALALRTQLERCIEPLGHKVTAEEISAIVSELFAEQRTALQAVIDRRLALLQSGAPEAQRDAAPRPSLDPRLSSAFKDEDLQTTQPFGPAKAPESAPGAERTPGQSTLRAVMALPPDRQRRAPLIAIGLGAGAALTGLLWLLLRIPPPAEEQAPRPLPAETAAPAPPLPTDLAPPPVASISPPASAASAATPERDTIEVRIAATPEGAQILVDGAPLPQNPFEGRFIKDGVAHRIQFEASGFAPQSRIQIFDRSFSFEVALKPKPKVDSGSSPVPTGLSAKPDPYGPVHPR